MGAMTALSVPAARADLISRLAFAGVLEAVASFAWLFALRGSLVTEIAVTPATHGNHAEMVMPVMTGE
jgi:hypothetical protein